jgi:hypothetical protein
VRCVLSSRVWQRAERELHDLRHQYDEMVDELRASQVRHARVACVWFRSIRASRPRVVPT